MNIKIKQLVINLAPAKTPPSGLIASLALSKAFDDALGNKKRSDIANDLARAATRVPAIGEKWPGTEAKYAGISLSECGTKLVHLIVWPDTFKERVTHEQAIKQAEEIAHFGWCSHLPTRYQGITLFTNLRDEFDKDYYHWLLEKTKDGKGAFIQNFAYGTQEWNNLDGNTRVRAVSEIPL